MTYAFTYDVPADEEMYGKIRALLPAQPPAGMISHVVIKRDAGLRYVDVWESETAWQTFMDEIGEPAVEKVLAGYGLPHEHSQVTLDEIDVIDVWQGATIRCDRGP